MQTRQVMFYLSLPAMMMSRVMLTIASEPFDETDRERTRKQFVALPVV